MRRVLGVLLLVFSSACGATVQTDAGPDDAVVTGSSSTTTSTVSPPTTTSASPSTTVAAATTTSTTVAPITFVWEVSEVSEAELGVSWRQGCPVGPGELRRVTVRHVVDHTGATALGELVVHVDAVDPLETVFASLYEAEFPIASMRPITEFDADDGASMVANNTSAFNCRAVAGTSRWSEHAYGTAIDVNPLVNPWVRGATVDPAQGAAYVDRTLGEEGMIVAGDVVVEAFAAIGWGWGGDWSGTKDYQHFSASGR